MKGFQLHFIFRIFLVSSLVGFAGISHAETEPVQSPPPEIKTAELGNIRAEVTIQREVDSFCAKRSNLKILRSGQLEREYDLSKQQGFCTVLSLEVKKLDQQGEPEVIVDNFSGGAHCCLTSWIYSYDTIAKRYVLTRHDWGNTGYELKDLDQDRWPEFRTRDDRFAYAFASYAGSLYPPQIWRYQKGRMVNVTRQYPKLVRAEAFQLWQYYQEAKGSLEGEKSALAAYLASKYLLGEAADGWSRVENAYRQPDASEFFVALHKFLAQTGYKAIPQK